MSKHNIQRLGWDGMETVTLDLPNFPSEALTVDDWFLPRIGELCLNDKHKIDVVKNIERNTDTSGVFKTKYFYSFENSDIKVSDGSIIRLEVKPGRTFIFNDKIFTHTEPLCGGYIDQMMRDGKVTKYEYGEYDLKA